MSDVVRFYSTGRRKTAVARVWINAGTGKILVNGRTPEAYFTSPNLLRIVRQPLVTSSLDNAFDVQANVDGGGLSGQAGAVRLGIARALLKNNPQLRKSLSDAGYLTRDPRSRERKKYGQKGARKRFQFSELCQWRRNLERINSSPPLSKRKGEKTKREKRKKLFSLDNRQYYD